MEKKKHINIPFTDEMQKAADEIRKESPLSYLSIPQVIEYALLETAGMGLHARFDEVLEVLGVKKVVELPEALIRGDAEPAEDKRGRGRPRTRVTEEDKEIEGRRVCEALGGEIRGQMCVYKRYEVTPAGFTVATEYGESYINLTEADIAKQYDPSKEAYEAAVASGAQAIG